MCNWLTRQSAQSHPERTQSLSATLSRGRADTAWRGCPAPANPLWFGEQDSRTLASPTVDSFLSSSAVSPPRRAILKGPTVPPCCPRAGSSPDAELPKNRVLSLVLRKLCGLNQHYHCLFSLLCAERSKHLKIIFYSVCPLLKRKHSARWVRVFTAVLSLLCSHCHTSENRNATAKNILALRTIKNRTSVTTSLYIAVFRSYIPFHM